MLEERQRYIETTMKNGGGSNKPFKRGGGTNKTPVVGVIDRKNKKVFARIALSDGEGKKLTAKQLTDILIK